MKFEIWKIENTAYIEVNDKENSLYDRSEIL